MSYNNTSAQKVKIEVRMTVSIYMACLKDGIEKSA